MDEEWVFFSDIRNTAGYPVGSGALVHASAARYIKQIDVICPPEMDRDWWLSAVPGRILHMELDHPDCERRVWLVGPNQHAAAKDRVQAREMVLASLKRVTTQANDLGLRLIILGYANSAPEGGRWATRVIAKRGTPTSKCQHGFPKHLCERFSPLPLKRHGKLASCRERRSLIGLGYSQLISLSPICG